MKNTNQIIGLMLSAMLITSSCNKEEETPVATTPTPNPTASMLCTGNGTVDYFPFKTGNRWVFKTSTTDVIKTYEGTKTVNSVLYHEIKVVADWTTYIYYRVDPNGDLYEKKDDFSHTEEIIVPGNPTVGQTWVDPNSNSTYNYSYEVMSLNASISTPSCSYTGLLQINEMFNGSVNYTRYYKKGLGLVKTTVSGSNDLKSVTLN